MNRIRIRRKYLGTPDGSAPGASGQSETQKQLEEMRAGERWAFEAASRANRVGGNEGHFVIDDPAVTDNGEMPGGVPRSFAVTDRNLDFEGEEGYPTPS